MSIHRIAIVGSRDFPGLHLVLSEIHARRLEGEFEIVSGGAPGVDFEAETYGLKIGLPVTSYRPCSQPAPSHQLPPPDAPRGRAWEPTIWGVSINHWPFAGQPFTSKWIELPGCQEFRHAAFARNSMIVDAANEVWAFWDGKSPGTEDTISKAKRARKVLKIYRPGEPVEVVGTASLFEEGA